MSMSFLLDLFLSTVKVFGGGVEFGYDYREGEINDTVTFDVQRRN